MTKDGEGRTEFVEAKMPVCVCVSMGVCVLIQYGGKHEACLAVSVLLPHQLDSASQ